MDEKQYKKQQKFYGWAGNREHKVLEY
jgi:hypothetical protein